MKNNTLFRILLASCLILPLFSCVKDEEDVFDKSASVRMHEALLHAQSVLTAAPNGWVMYYYPEGNQVYGGFIHTLNFTEDGNVTIASELFDEPATSTFRMGTDDGPVLSFDTNNYVFHYFATPSGSMPNQYGESGRYQAYKGDFEFMIMKAEADEVILLGKRTRNKIYMYPLSEEPASYMEKVLDMNEQLFVSSFTGTIGSDPAEIYLSLGNRQATITLTGDKYLDENGEPASVTVAYLCTPTGISLYQETEIGPYKLKDLTFDTTSQKLVESQLNLDMQGELPEGWHAYNDFPGTYSLQYNDGAMTMEGIEIKPDVKGKSFIISGMSKVFDVTASYDLGLGRIHVQAQYVADQTMTENDYLVMMACWDSNAGKVTYSNGGLYGILDEEGNSISWVDNGLFSGRTVDGFILYYFTSAGSRVGATTAPWLWSGREERTSGGNQLWGWVSFDRQ